MPLDGFATKALVNELQRLLPINKIEKVYQPEADEIVLLIRSKGVNYRLLLSGSSNYPRIHFTDKTKENPSIPPSFCMLLRKHLQGGKITNIIQPNFERIIKIEIEALDELNIVKTKELIIEIMGKHSNIILVEQESNKVIDSIKRVPFDISRYRQILPGITYQMPPSQDKKNPLEIDCYNTFREHLLVYPQESIVKAIYTAYTGFSPVIAREICFLAGIEENTSVFCLDESLFEKIFSHFNSILSYVQKTMFTPTIYIDEKAYSQKGIVKYIDFSVFSLKHLDYYESKIFSSISTLLESFYFYKDQREHIRQKSHSMRKSTSTKLERIYNKIQNLQRDLENARKLDRYKLMGDLLTAYMYQLEKGMDSIIIENFYDDSYASIPFGEKVKIPLDSRLTPAQNAQKYYKKYNKAKTALLEIDKQLKFAYDEVSYLEQILVSIDQSTSLSDLDEIHTELVETNYIKKRTTKKVPKHGKKNSHLKFISSEGMEILVGKNNKQNDEITFKLSSKNDLWFHVKNIPGSHVILRCDLKSPSDISILEAGILAAYYSKARGGTKVSVDYTSRKNVKKPTGSKPGMVIYDNFSTLLVDCSEKNVNKIQESK